MLPTISRTGFSFYILFLDARENIEYVEEITMEVLLIAVAIALMLVGFFGYNPLRKKYAGIIGVGGSYIVLLGVMLLVSSIGQIFASISGESNISALEIILGIVVMLLCLGYMVFVMLTRCETIAQRIMLPVVACLIGFGFCWRLLAAIVFHMPMESGKQESSSFPKYLYDDSDNRWELINQGGDNANYHCHKTGETRMFYISDFDLGSPSGFYQK